MLDYKTDTVINNPVRNKLIFFYYQIKLKISKIN